MILRQSPGSAQSKSTERKWIASADVVPVLLARGEYFMPLFVVIAEGATLDDPLRARIVAAIRHDLSPRHVPDSVVAIPAVPRTLTGRKLEVPVKRILQGARAEEVKGEGAVLHPEMLTWFEEFATRWRNRGIGGTGVACAVG
jgi:acetoacetyl-CoA synthetase